MKKKRKNNKTNIFMKVIYDKTVKNKIHRFINKIKCKRFLKNISNGSPSFFVLWNMAEFVKLAEDVFFYNNNVDSPQLGIYSSRNFSDNQNGFKIITNECTIIVKLFEESRRVALDISRNIGFGLKTQLSFKNEEWEKDNPTIYDEMVLEECIKIINNHVLTLFKFCYEKR